MSDRSWIWPSPGTPAGDERKAAVESALRGSRTRMEAAAKLGVTPGSLYHATNTYGLSPSALLGRAAPAPEAGVFVPPPDPTPRTDTAKDEGPVVTDWSHARPTSTGEGVERRIVLSDTHIPYHSASACTAALALIRALQPHRIEILGDWMNNGAVSHHPRPFGGPEKHAPAVQSAIALLEAIRKAAPGAAIDFLEGNHDVWGAEYEDANQAFSGMFYLPNLFDFERIGIRHVPRSEQPLVLGPVGYLHGTGGGEYAVRRYAERTAPLAGVKCIVAGHHHCVAHWTARNGCEAWIAGWLGDRRHSAFDYARKGGDPAHWSHAVLIQDVLGDRVTTTPVPLINGTALFAGRLVAAA